MSKPYVRPPLCESGFIQIRHLDYSKLVESLRACVTEMERSGDCSHALASARAILASIEP